MSSTLPVPGAEAVALSHALEEHLRAGIAQAGGCLPFDAFMNAALYAPGLGYYTNGLMPFGEQGDYITAPESGALFGRCLARSIASVLGQIKRGVVVELGAGSGVLAVDVLTELAALGALPQRYFILERSGAMRALQQETLSQRAPDAIDRVEWLDEIPAAGLSGVVFGNEVADALPVKRFRWCDGRVTELGVGWSGDQLTSCELPAGEALSHFVRQRAQDGDWGGTYLSEVCPSLGAWINSLTDSLKQGLLLIVDYGYGRSEYYHPQRSMGTLMCHYRHQAHGDPLWYPGLQDITAFVDFTAIAEAASDAGLRLEGYTGQAQYLLACGIDELMSEVDPQDTRRYLRLSNEAKRLLLPGEMGDRFKVMGFSRGLEQGVKGFGSQDLRSRL